jgi:DNA-binding NtrC family response regulator
MTNEISILVVDDDAAMLKLFADLIASDETVVTGASSAEQALQITGRTCFDVAFVDVSMPGMDGFELLNQMKKNCPDTEVVMISGYSSVESAVKAMKFGASDYLPKPFKTGQVNASIDRVRKLKALRLENLALKRQLAERHRTEGIIGMTPGIEEIRETIGRVAGEDCTVLIHGESGTGKELIARAIHFNSRRAVRPFVTVDCGSVNRNLIESELFGHEKGSFTGAYARKTGLFVKAAGGTVFLDEIGEIPVDVQPSLLRAIEDKRVRPVGSTEVMDVDVRIVTATNRDLQEATKTGQFRLDLFYRLNVVAIAVPPLRSRKDDIPLLVDHFVRKLGSKEGYRSTSGISRDAMIVLLRYDWPGNVRELENAVERALALGKGGQIETDDLPPAIVIAVEDKKEKTGTRVAGQCTLALLEKDAIVRTLRRTRADTDAAAKILGIDRSTLYRKLKNYDISLAQFKRNS